MKDLKAKAEWKARTFIERREEFGDKFKPGAYEVLTYAFLNNSDVDSIVRIADKFTYGKALTMPWGKEVTING